MHGEDSYRDVCAMFQVFQTKLPDVPFTQTHALCQQKVKVAEHFLS